MKTIKCLLASAFIAFSATAFAQNLTADLAHMESVISNSTAFLNPKKDVDLKNFEKAYKKDATAMAQLARLFFNAEDTANARLYAQKSIDLVEKKNNIECGEGYIVIGDIFYLNERPGDAARYYELAKIHDPKNPKAYEKVAGVYRKANPDAAVAQLKDLAEIDPTYPANAVAAGFYYDAMKWGRARDYFKKEDESKLREEDFQKYVYIENYYADYRNCLRIAELGLAKYPDDVTCNRYKMFSQVQLKDYAGAAETAKHLFACKKYKEYGVDYRFYAQALLGMGDADAALQNLNKSLELNADQPEINKIIADVYAAKDNEDKHIEYMETYLDKYENASFSDFFNLSQKYDSIATVSDEPVKTQLLKKEDAMLSKMLVKFPGKQLKYIHYQRARINDTIGTAESKAVAATSYQSLIEVVQKEDASDTNKALQLLASKYLLDYYNSIGDSTKAETYKQLILQLQQ